MAFRLVTTSPRIFRPNRQPVFVSLRVLFLILILLTSLFVLLSFFSLEFWDDKSLSSSFREGQGWLSLLLNEPKSTTSLCRNSVSLENGGLGLLIDDSVRGIERSTLHSLRQLFLRDATFSVGFGVSLLNLDQAITGASNFFVLTTSAERANTCKNHVYIESSRPIIHPNFGHLEQPSLVSPPLAAEFISSARASLAQAMELVPSRSIKLAILMVWAGGNPPSSRFLRAAQSFLESDTSIDVFVAVEGIHRQEVNSRLPSSDRLVVLTEYPGHGGNLTQYIHARADELVPKSAGHARYPLAWALCDFRWMFGEIFGFAIPMNVYSHWGWGDSDALLSRGFLAPYERDVARYDVISFAHIDVRADFVQTTTMAYTSGTLTIVKNTLAGRNLFRATPEPVLIRAIVSASNGILDESGTSNAVLAAAGVTAVLIPLQGRNRDMVISKETGKIYIVPRTKAASNKLTQLALAGRVAVGDDFCVEPLAATNSQVRGRFTGNKPLIPANFINDPNPVCHGGIPMEPSRFELGKGIGSGLASIIKDETGSWYHRPLPKSILVASKNRTDRYARLEIAVAHIRDERACFVAESQLEGFDVNAYETDKEFEQYWHRACSKHRL